MDPRGKTTSLLELNGHICHDRRKKKDEKVRRKWATLTEPTILKICFREERPVLDKEFAILKESHDRVDYRLWEAIPDESCLHRFARDQIESLLPVQEQKVARCGNDVQNDREVSASRRPELKQILIYESRTNGVTKYHQSKMRCGVGALKHKACK